MKRVSVLLLSFVLFYLASSVYAGPSDMKKGVRMHDGLYLNCGLGATYGLTNYNITPRDPSPYSGIVGADYDLEGFGYEADIKLGTAIANNFIFHGMFLVNTSSAEYHYFDGTIKSATMTCNNLALEAGVTYYAPKAFLGFYSFSAGVGSIKNDKKIAPSVDDELGVALQFKSGYEWSLNETTAIGISAGLNYIAVSGSNKDYNVDSYSFRGFLGFNVVFD